MALTKLKIAVFAPMPRASVSTAIAVKAGFFSNIRTAYFKSFMRAIYDSRLGRGQTTKTQTPNFREIPSCKPQTAPRYRHIGTWSFFDDWDLVFGVSLLASCGWQPVPMPTLCPFSDRNVYPHDDQRLPSAMVQLRSRWMSPLTELASTSPLTLSISTPPLTVLVWSRRLCFGTVSV